MKVYRQYDEDNDGVIAYYLNGNSVFFEVELGGQVPQVISITKDQAKEMIIQLQEILKGLDNG
jgi:hypothetical protein